MKSKLLVGALAVASVLALGSCKRGQKEDFSVARYDKDVDSALKTDIGLFNDGNGVKLESKDGTNYIDIYVASDAKASLFVYDMDLSSYFSKEEGSRNKYITISALSFDNILIYDSEKTTVVNDLLAEKNGAKDKLGSDIGFDVFTDGAYTRDITSTAAYEEYKANGGAVKLSIVYMPVYVAHYVTQKAGGSQKVLSTNMLVPIYATFINKDNKEITAQGLKDTKIATMKHVDLSDYLTGVSEFGKIKNTLVEA